MENLSIKEFIKVHYAMKNTKRMSGRFTLQSYNLLEHSFMVGNLFLYLAKVESVEVTLNDYYLAMHHDVLEAYTGDLNYLVKNKSEKTKSAWEFIESEIWGGENSWLYRYTDGSISEKLGPIKASILKIADLLDLWIFAMQESKHGNTSTEITEILDNCSNYINDIAEKSKLYHIDNLFILLEDDFTNG